jgi:acyl carrier protein
MDAIIEDDVLPRTVEIIARACRKTATAESRLAEDLTFDSIDLVHLVAEMEAEFDVVVTEDQLRTLRTVDDAVRVVRSLKKGGAADA